MDLSSPHSDNLVLCGPTPEPLNRCENHAIGFNFSAMLDKLTLSNTAHGQALSYDFLNSLLDVVLDIRRYKCHWVRDTSCFAFPVVAIVCLSRWTSHFTGLIFSLHWRVTSGDEGNYVDSNICYIITCNSDLLAQGYSANEWNISCVSLWSTILQTIVVTRNVS